LYRYTNVIDSPIFWSSYSTSLTFGYTLALNDVVDYLVVGATNADTPIPGTSTSLANNGEAYIYKFTNDWDEIGMIAGNSDGDQFGGSTAINGAGTIGAVGTVSGEYVKVFQVDENTNPMVTSNEITVAGTIDAGSFGISEYFNKS
jgi:hypothetical protein